MPIETRRKAGSTAKVGDALSAPIESGQHLATVAAMEVPPQFVNVERPQISTEIHDDPVDDEKSLELSKIFLILAISELCYGRRLFPRKCFTPREVRANDKDLSYRRLVEPVSESWTPDNARGFLCLRRNVTSICNQFLDAIEHGVFKTLEKNQLHGIVLRIFEDREHPYHILEKHFIELKYPPARCQAASGAQCSPLCLRSVLSDLSDAFVNFIRIPRTFRSLPHEKYLDIELIHSLPGREQPRYFQYPRRRDIDFVTVNDHSSLRLHNSLLHFSTGRVDFSLAITTVKQSDDDWRFDENHKHKIPVRMPQGPLLRSSKRRFKSDVDNDGEETQAYEGIALSTQARQDVKLACDFNAMSLPLPLGTQATEPHVLSSSMPIQSTPLPVSSAANLYTIGPASSPGPPTSSSGSTERALPTSKAPPNEPPQAKLIGVSRRPLSPKAIRKVRGPSDKVLEGIGVARGSSLLPCRVGKELSQNIAGLRKPAEPSTDILAKSEETIAVAYAAVHGEVWTAKRPAEEELMQVSQVKKASNMRARRIRAPTRRSERKKV